MGETAIFKVNGSSCLVTGRKIPVQIHHLIGKMCSYLVPDAERYDSVIAGKWDGRERLYRGNEFPVGLLDYVVAVLLGIYPDFEFEIEDQRPEPKKRHEWATNLVLRDYQEEIVQEAVEARSGNIPLATGGGKTVIAIEIAARLGLPTLIVVPSKELLYQTSRRIHETMGITAGIVGNQEWDPQILTVASWQTLSRRLKGSPKKELDVEKVKKKKGQRQDVIQLLYQFPAVIFDEVHHYGADELYNLARNCPARYRYGLSGTMFRTDNADLKFIGSVGSMLSGRTASQLIRDRWLVRPNIKFTKTDFIYYDRRSTYDQVYKDYVVENPERNALIVDDAVELVEDGRRTLVLVTQINHGRELKRILQLQIPEVKFVHAGASERPKLVSGFRNGEIPCLISTPMFDEGIDIPEIAGVVLAGAGQSQIKTVQRIGRGLRPWPDGGKQDCAVRDYMDPVKFLYEQCSARYHTYKEEEEFHLWGDLP